MVTLTATMDTITETGPRPVPVDRPTPVEGHAMSRMAWLFQPYLPIS